MLNFSFRHMETSEPLIEYATTKIKQNLEKFSTQPIQVHTTFLVDNHTHIVKTHVSGVSGDFEVKAESMDMYASVDLLVGKLKKQLKKSKEKQKEHRSWFELPLEES